MKAQHTPGPWADFDDLCVHATRDNNGYHLLIATVEHCDTGSDAAKANARLIALAPEMWAVLSRAVNSLSTAIDWIEDMDILPSYDEDAGYAELVDTYNEIREMVL